MSEAVKPQGDSQIAVHCFVCIREGHPTPATIMFRRDGRHYFTCDQHANTDFGTPNPSRRAT